MCLSICYIEVPLFKYTLNASLCLGIYSSHSVSVIHSLPFTSASFFLLLFLKNAGIFNYPSEHSFHAFNLIVFWHQWTMLQYYASVFL